MVCMVIVMMLGPNVLRHPGQDPEPKPNLTIQPTAAEQAAMAALVHQAEGAHDEENDEWQREQGEPAGDFSATDSAPPEKCDRDQGREDLSQCFEVIGLGISRGQAPLLTLQALFRQFEPPPGSKPHPHRATGPALAGTSQYAAFGPFRARAIVDYQGMLESLMEVSDFRLARVCSALLPVRHDDLIEELQQASPPGGRLVTSRTPALENTLGVVRDIGQCVFDGPAEIELPVAIRIWTAIFEKRTGRRIEHVRQGGRGARVGPSEPQLDTKMLECRERDAQHLSRSAIAPRLIHFSLASRSGRSESHEPFPGVRSR